MDSCVTGTAESEMLGIKPSTLLLFLGSQDSHRSRHRVLVMADHRALSSGKSPNYNVSQHKDSGKFSYKILSLRGETSAKEKFSGDEEVDGNKTAGKKNQTQRGKTKMIQDTLRFRSLPLDTSGFRSLPLDTSGV